MPSRIEQNLFVFANEPAETQNHRLFLRPDGEKAGTEKRQHHQHHHDFDNRETAVQRLGQRLRAGVVRCHRRGCGMLVRVLVFVIVAHGYRFGALAGRCWNKSNGGVRSSKIKVARWLSDCCSALMRSRKFASSGFC